LWKRRWLVTVAMCAACGAARADGDSPERLPEVVVEGRADGMIGVAGSASEGAAGTEQLAERPLLRPGEVLETVPGVVVTQHSGEGKANQYFLRGFNLDHGTDFATTVDGVPVNLPSHGHGQGYTDLGFMIPELVRTVSYRKGVYSAADGDFSSAGAADLAYFDTLPSGIASLQGGTFGEFRALLADSPEVAGGHLLYAGELAYDDGPWRDPSNFLKGNLVLRYATGDAAAGWSLTGMGYKADWGSTDQIAQRAVDRREIDRFGTLDDSDGGKSQRYGLTAEWHRSDAASATKLLLFGYYYDLDLFSNFTYFLEDPVHGDQFEQTDSRWVSGLRASHDFAWRLGGVDTDDTVGFQFRSDSIQNGLFHTERRERLGTTRADAIGEYSLAPYLETREQWTPWLRSTAGVRFDGFRFDVRSNLRANSGSERAALPSPKLSIVAGPWADTELYLDAGLGFHSNDARGTTIRVDPKSGGPAQRVDPLVRTTGAEVGLRTTRVSSLQSTVALWWLDIDSELLFAGDAGATEASRPSRRCGIELTNFYTPTGWLTFDADLAWTHARFRDSDPAGDHVPGAPDAVIATGVSLHDLGGFFGGVRARYFGPRPLVEDGSVRSDSTFLLSGQVGWRFDERWTVKVEAFNILDRKDSDISYFYASRLRNEAPGPDEGGYDDIHFHPVEPASVRVSVSTHF
jgi:hypothetical protein